MNKPKGYSPGSAIENKSVNIVNYLLDPGYTFSHISKNDKTPNHDGLIDILNGEHIVTGTVQVQVKTFDHSRPMKFSMDTSFIPFCKGNLLPTILLLVDTRKEVVYWRHIDEQFIKKNLRTKAKTITITFTNEQVISRENSNYIEIWQDLYSARLQRQFNYELLEQEKARLAKQLNVLQKLTDRSYRQSDKRFTTIHTFLDQYNYLLDHDFTTVKQLLYCDVWKLGIAIQDYSQNELNYTKYPIYPDTNDTLIKLIEMDGRERIDEESIAYIGMNVLNEMQQDPLRYAYDCMGSDTMRVIKDKYISLAHPHIAMEMLIEFIDDYYLLLGVRAGLPAYNLKKILIALNNFLPLVLEELGYLNRKKKKLHSSIDAIIWPTPFPILRKAIKRARIRFVKKRPYGLNYSIESNNYDLTHIDHYLALLQSSGTKTIDRQYPIMTISRKGYLGRAQEKTVEIVRAFLESIYLNLPVVYDHIIRTYFPSLYDTLKYYSDFNRLIIIYGKDFEPPFVTHSDFEIILLTLQNLDNPGEKLIQIFAKDDPKLPVTKSEMMFRESEIILNTSRYKMINMSTSGDDFLFRDKPVTTLVYELLEKRFEKYFKDKS